MGGCHAKMRSCYQKTAGTVTPNSLSLPCIILRLLKSRHLFLGRREYLPSYHDKKKCIAATETVGFVTPNSLYTLYHIYHHIAIEKHSSTVELDTVKEEEKQVRTLYPAKWQDCILCYLYSSSRPWHQNAWDEQASGLAIQILARGHCIAPTPYP